MEAVKKKLATLKEEKEVAVERAEEAEKAKKEAEDRAEQVRVFDCNDRMLRNVQGEHMHVSVCYNYMQSDIDAVEENMRGR